MTWIYYFVTIRFPIWQLVVKNLPANKGDIRDTGSIPWSVRSSGGWYGNPVQYSCLEIPWTEEPGGLQFIGSWRVGHDWSNLAQKATIKCCYNPKTPWTTPSSYLPCSLATPSGLPPMLPCPVGHLIYSLDLSGICLIQFSSVQSLSRVRFFATPWIAARQASLSITNSQSSLRLTSIEDAIKPFHPLSSPSPPAPNHSQHQSLFQWVNSSHEVAKVLELQL